MLTPINRELLNCFPVLTEALLKNLVKAADQAGIKRIAVVGGIIRDQLINKSLNQSPKKFFDIDLIIEEDPKKLAESISNLLGDSRVNISRFNHLYQTVELKIDGIPVDIARARIEKYPVLAANPKIKPAHLEDDLSRRDFTINAIALDLRTNQLIDYLQGREAIINRKIEFIHSRSVAEDPTRVIRAARYAARLGFNLTSESLNQIKSTISLWPWNHAIDDKYKDLPSSLCTRLQMELKVLLEKENNWAIAIQYLQEWGALILIDKKIQNDKYWKRRINWALRLGLNPLTAFISNSINPVKLAERLDLSHSQQKLLSECTQINEHFLSLYVSKKTANWDAQRWCEEIESASWDPTAIAIAICLGNPLWRPLLRWWGRWRLIKAEITAEELIKKGWEQGPALGQELKRLRMVELKKHKRTNPS